MKTQEYKVRYGKSGVRHMGEMGAVGETQKNKITLHKGVDGGACAESEGVEFGES